MKIDYRNFPVLLNLENKHMRYECTRVEDSFILGKIYPQYSDYWNIFREKFKQEINIISNPFWQATLQAGLKLEDLLCDILDNDLSDFIVQGTYILGEYVCMINFESYHGDSKVRELAFYIFDKRGVLLAFQLMSSKNEISNVSWVSFSQLELSTTEERELWIGKILHRIFIIKMFKSYATVETKLLKPKQKVVDIVCKYKNNTNLNLTFLDSKWFTNLVKSDAFKVRGHFRLQPKKKDGEWTKELIWINDFQKQGYTAQARILTNS